MGNLKKYAPGIVVFSFGIIISLLLYNFERKEELAEKSDYIEKHVLERKFAIESEMRSTIGLLKLFEHDWEIPFSEFKQLAKPMLKSHKNIVNICWVEKIGYAEIDNLYRKAKVNDIKDYFIKELSSDGGFIEASKRDWYYPAIYSEPTHLNNELLTGYDFGSNNNILETINTAIERRETRLTNCEMFIKDDNYKGLVVIHPIFDSEINSNLKAMIFARLEIKKILESILYRFKDENIGVNIYDISDSLNVEKLGYYIPENEIKTKKKDIKYDKEYFNYVFTIANKTWELEFFTINFNGKAKQANTWLFISLFLTGIFSLYIVTRIRRTEQIRKLSKKLKNEIGERSKIEEVLRRSENKFRLLYENAPLAYQSLDSNGKFIDVNKTWLSLLGYDKEEIEDKFFGDIMTSGSQKLVKSRFENFLKTGSVNNAEFELIRKDDSKLDIVLNGTISYDKEGNFIQTHCIFNDITERKRIENEIKKHQFYLEKAQEIGKIGTWEVDLIKNNLTWTKENYKIFGIKEGTQVDYELFLSRIHPEDRDFVDTKWKEGILANEYNIEHRLLIDGEIKWVREKADFILDNNGKCIKAIGVCQDITNKRIDELLLEESEEKYREFIEGTEDLITQVDKEGNYRFVNHISEQIFGCKPHECIGISALSFVHPEDAEFTKQEFDRWIKRRVSSATLENRIINKKGEIHDLLWTISFHYGDDGIKEINSIGTNISIRKKAEETLKKHQYYLEKAQELGSIGTWELNLVKPKLMWTDENYKIFEIPIGSAIEPDEFMNFVHPDDVGKVEREWEKSLENKKYETEHRIIVNNQVKWIKEKADFIVNEKGENVKVIGVTQDITDRKKTEQELNKLFTAVEQSANSILITDNDGKIEYVNKKFTELSGYNIKEAIGQNPRLLKSGYHPDKFYKDMWNTVSNGEIWTGETRNKKKNGTLFWERSTITPITDDNNQIKNYIAIKEDISEMKLAQEKLIRNESALQKIITGTANKGGLDYFEDMVLRFDEIIEPDYIFIGELIEDQKVKTISLVSKGKVLDNFSYDLKDTPCDDVIGKNTCFHEKNVTELFPKDLLLVDMGIEAYVGTPLYDSNKSGIGIIVALFKEPLIDSSFVRSMFEIFAVNIGSEMERTKTEQYLMESEEKFRSYFQSNLAPMIILDVKTKNIKDTNQAAENFYGYTRKEFLEKNIYDINTLSKDEINLNMKDAISRRSNYFTFKHKLSDGSLRDIELYSTFLKEKEKNLMYLIIHDISARTEAERALIENEEKYRAAFQTSPDSVAISTMEGVYVDINEGFKTTTGYTEEEVIGKSVVDKNIWAYPKEREQLISDLNNFGECNNLEVQFNCKDGSKRIGLLSGKFIRIDNKPHILTITRDITKQKEKDKLVLKAIIDTEEKERKRFAEDLHDELGPFLSGIKLYIKELGYKDVSFEQRISIIEYLNEFINSAVEKTRTISNQLMPNVLIDYGLIKALKSFCERINNTQEINVNFDSNIEERINQSTIEVILYRIGIELINNTLKHAGADLISISLNRYSDIVQLTYIDNGKGFNFEEVIKKDKGLGVRNMVSRLESIKGKFRFTNKKNGIHINIIIDLSLT